MKKKLLALTGLFMSATAFAQVAQVTPIAQQSVNPIYQSNPVQEEAKQELSKIITLPSGVKLRMVRPGRGGELPNANSRVEVNYRGILEDGREFDSSYKLGQTVELGLNQVIQCWREAIPMMTPGAIMHLYCPSQTAYGSQSAGGVIPPNANLTFQVELVSIK